MTVSITFTNGSGTIGEILEGWGVTEEATPVALGDIGGGVGSVGLTAKQEQDSEFVIDNSSTFTHDRLGSISGKVATITSNGATEDTDTIVGLSTTTPLSVLSVDRVAGPLAGGVGPIIVTSIPQVVSTSSRYTPGNIFSDAAGYTYLMRNAASGGAVLQKYDNQWNLLSEQVSVAGANAFSVFSNFVIDSAGYRYIVGNTPNVILKFDSTGTYVTQWGSLGSGNGQFNSIGGMALDSLNNLYVVDRNNYRIQVFTPPGLPTNPHVYSLQWGSVGLGNLQFEAPKAITVSSDNFVYVTDGGSSAPPVMRKFSITGTFILRFGINGTGYPESGIRDSDGGSWGAFLSSDSYGNVYESDSKNSIIRKFDSLGYAGIVAPIRVQPTQGNSYVSGTGLTVNKLSGSIYFASSSNYASGINADPLATSYVFEYLGDTPRISEAIKYYCGLILTTGFAYSYTATNNARITAQGWSGNVWEYLKQLCQVYGIEISVVSNTITVRDVGGRTLDIDNVRSGSVSLQLDSRATSRSLNIPYQQSRSGSGTIYNASDTGKVFTIGVGERTTETVTANSSPVGINAVVQTNSTTILAGQYYVIASDNLPVTSAQWAAYGGSVSVAINATIPNSIDVTVQGPTTAIPGVVAPYSLAISDGTNTYPAFSVTGTGVFFTPITLNLLTGADNTKTPVVSQDLPTNVFLNTLTQAYDRGTWAAVIASGPLLTLTATVPTSAVSGFGIAEGAMVSFKKSIYRITSANISNDWTSITATRHVTVADFAPIWTGQTVGTFNTYWLGKDTEDLFIKPLAH